MDTDYYSGSCGGYRLRELHLQYDAVRKSEAPASFLQYTNTNAGVDMNYPSDWQLTGNPAVGTIARFGHGNDTILFEIQRTALNQTGQTVQSIASNYISAIQKSNGSASLLENHSTSLGGLPGYKTVTAFKQGG